MSRTPKVLGTNEGRFSIQDIAKSAHVTRWHSASCYRYPNIAEHSFLVLMYARELLYRIVPNATESEQLLLLEYCAFHDLPEVLTGDMATPVKRRLESFFPEGESPLDLIEEALCPDYKVLKGRIKGSYLASIAKLADVLEAAKFIDFEGKKQTSNHEANSQTLKILKQLAECMTPTPEQALKIKEIQDSIESITQRENNDPILLIREERIQNYKQRIEIAREQFPELNWDAAYDVLDELLYGTQSQIDFIDK